ncbi:hypothetical protein [Bradyrhizobium liaoningense]|uniref:hypothetical protein n=1 Tax=Bradyrhizobium liaoningense TaxID=43992 RepID=UPI001BA8AE61|nr:hypothetical protein [Bradyrhizobium liaoningense]MBR1033699.1 hypothetical protein [Bradyrhizobium liaoningense]
MDNDERKNIIEVWKAVVGVQQHFNEIEMKVRGLFITIVVAIAAAQGFLIEKKLSVSERLIMKRERTLQRRSLRQTAPIVRRQTGVCVEDLLKRGLDGFPIAGFVSREFFRPV